MRAPPCTPIHSRHPPRSHTHPAAAPAPLPSRKSTRVQRYAPTPPPDSPASCTGPEEPSGDTATSSSARAPARLPIPPQPPQGTQKRNTLLSSCPTAYVNRLLARDLVAKKTPTNPGNSSNTDDGSGVAINPLWLTPPTWLTS